MPSSGGKLGSKLGQNGKILVSPISRKIRVFENALKKCVKLWGLRAIKISL